VFVTEKRKEDQEACCASPSLPPSLPRSLFHALLFFDWRRRKRFLRGEGLKGDEEEAVVEAWREEGKEGGREGGRNSELNGEGL